MKNIRVFKVGGSVLSAPEDFLKIARRIVQFKASKICLVTSAIKGTTDELIKTYTGAIPEPDFFNFETFVGMGEIQSAIIFESAFRHLGCPAKAVIPDMPEWPIHICLKTKTRLAQEKINEKRDFTLLGKSKKICRHLVIPLLSKGTILVIPGFVAKDDLGRTVTLGRGGSDISALFMAELLGADELILIKDVDGILSLDPKFAANGTNIRSMAWAELGALAASGAQVLNPISLKHRKRLPKLRIISNKDNEPLDRGTEVLFDKEVSIHVANKTYGVLTFIGTKLPETSGIFSEISRILAQKRIAIHSITISDNLLAIYVEEKEAEIAYRLLSVLISRIRNLKALNLKKGIAKIVVRSLKFINEPGALRKIVSPIARKKINIWEVLTVHTDIMVFVEAADKEMTRSFIKQLFVRSKNGKSKD